MKSNQLTLIGAIFFFIGLILILISWHLTYPIYMPELSELTFIQFYPSIWPGVIFSLIGLFLTGYYSKRKGVKVVCASFFPIILYSYSFYFSYINSSDSGIVRAMFEVFHQVGINSEVVSYFQYPIYFTLNETTSQILGLGVKGIAVIFFAFFGILLGLYIFLFLSKITKNNTDQLPFLGVLLYFTAIFSFLNYQWVPQTLALVFLLLLFIFFDKKGFEYKLLSIAIFTTLVFTHVFIPVIFLLFFGLYVIQKKGLRSIFLLMTCIYISVLISYTTYYFPIIVDTFKNSIYGFVGGDYSVVVSRSFREPTGHLSQFISLANRIRIPLTWLVVSTGFLILFIKKKISLTAIFLGITSGIYLGVGMLYPILGMRALQILLIPLVVGFAYSISRWKKPMLTFVVILLIFSVFGPMRAIYDQTQFQLDEEEYACNFLANALPSGEEKSIAIGQVNWGYFTTVYRYLNGATITAIRPGNPEFYRIFNDSIEKNEYIMYNPNLGKEIRLYAIEPEEVYSLIKEYSINNKIYECGKTFIVTGK